MTAMDELLAVAKALAAEEQDRIVARFVKLNPGWNGAETADILEALDSTDANLADTESWYAEHPDYAGSDAVNVALLALIWSAPPGPLDLSPERVTALLERAGVDLP